MADTVPFAPDRFSGRKLGKYEVLCRLSTGGMSEIFLAFQRGLAGFRKLVVLKQILPDIKGEEDIVRMFLDEAKITAAFAHPNIAQVFDLDVADGELFLAMEFVPGATLIEVARSCRMAQEPIPLGFSLATVRDTALGLHYAHTFRDPMGRPRQVIHRDVAEKNIMVTYDGTTKLLDFGIAKRMGRSSRTMVGKVKGTSGYMSPEQIMGDTLDPRSDIFSLGVVLHECFTGMRLFYGRDAEEGMKAALEGDPPPPSLQNPQVTRELDAVVMRALARNREDRFSTSLEFARAIERAAGGRIWHPEQSGELMQRHFATRRDETQRFLQGVGEVSGEVEIPRMTTDPGEPEHVTDRPPVRVDPLTSLPHPRRGMPALAGPGGVLPPPPMGAENHPTGPAITAPSRAEDSARTRIKPPRKRQRIRDTDEVYGEDEETHGMLGDPLLGTEPTLPPLRPPAQEAPAVPEIGTDRLRASRTVKRVVRWKAPVVLGWMLGGGLVFAVIWLVFSSLLRMRHP